MPRAILHADLDAFYASVEQLDHPDMRGKPVVVGGSPEHRGVVAAASYEARAFGIRSAMPMSRAMRLCPDAIRVPPRFGRYGELSRQVMDIFRALTPSIEPLSLDEAFLDVTAAVTEQADVERIARKLKDDVKAATELTLSVGGGENKTVAKIASDFRKPDGLVVVPWGEEAAFLAPLPIRALWGVGPKTEQHLVRAGIRTIGDAAARSEGEMTRLLGSRGPFLRAMAQGHDDRPIESSWERKSVGAENTFAQDLPDGSELRAHLRDIATEVARRMSGLDVRAHTIALKLRYSDFRTITRQATLSQPVGDPAVIEATALRLLEECMRDGGRVRLLGIQCSKLTGDVAVQRSFWTLATDDA